MDELKPCPFCGNIPEPSSTSLYVCKTCLLQIHPRIWKYRPIEDALSTQLEQARELSEVYLGAADAFKEQLEQARVAFDSLVEYIDRNTLNFQLEKLDDYIRQLSEALGTEVEDEAL